MGGAGAMIFLVAFLVIGLSIWGLFNRGRSILCALAGILIVPVAAILAAYAWVESHSIPGTVIYSIAALIGVVSVLRQVWPRKQEPKNAEQSPAGDVPEAAPEE